MSSASCLRNPLGPGVMRLASLRPKISPVISSSGLTGSLDLSVTTPGFKQPVKRRFDSSPSALRRHTGRPLFVRRGISTGRAMEFICVSNPRSVPACFVSRYSNSTMRNESSTSAAISSLFRLGNPERKQFLRMQSSISSARFSLLLHHSRVLRSSNDQRRQKAHAREHRAAAGSRPVQEAAARGVRPSLCDHRMCNGGGS